MSASDTAYCGSPAEVLSILAAIAGPATSGPPVSGSVGAGGGGCGAGVGLGFGVGDGFAVGVGVELVGATWSPPEEQPTSSRAGMASTPSSRATRIDPPGDCPADRRHAPCTVASGGARTAGPAPTSAL